MITSSAFGSFDPLAPCNLSGLFAQIVFADPVEIDADVETVWKIMTDFDRYPEWNPLNRFFRLDGEARPGHTVTFGPVWGPYDLSEKTENSPPLPKAGFTQHETLTIWEENRCLAYSVLSRPFNAERVQYISNINDGRTRYQTFERTDGFFSPIVRALYARKITEGFTANGIALKRRAERFQARGTAAN